MRASLPEQRNRAAIEALSGQNPAPCGAPHQPSAACGPGFS
jgi:hypothetical protein